MSATRATAELERWFATNAGYLHPSIRILQDGLSGVHYRSTGAIQPGATLASASHSVTLSYLNALVDDSLPVFKQQRHRFKVEAIGFFYLMAQYINREASFWRPYLDTLPGPEAHFSQPLFFEDAHDIAWLEGTDVWHTVTARKAVYKQYYDDGISVLRQAGIDVQPYTWHLFKWAATIFTSRSFSSRALHPEDSKYWTTYKVTSDERRQTVLLDMSHTPAEDLDFPVLFPGLDAANHNHDAHVEWTFDPGRFSIASNDSFQVGAEVFNNYGPKGNGELLIGYGFCIPNNPFDTVALTLKEPPSGLLSDMKLSHTGYFTPTGKWNAEKATFRLTKPAPFISNPGRIFEQLPEQLLELLEYILQHERGEPFAFIPHPRHHLSGDGEGSRYRPHIARMVAQFLIQKSTQLYCTQLPPEPQGDKQLQASTYRTGQVTILEEIVSALRSFTRSLIWDISAASVGLPPNPCLVKLEDLVKFLTSNSQLDKAFLDGIEASANTRDLEQLRLAGWEEDVWVLLSCCIRLDPGRYDARVSRSVPEGRSTGNAIAGHAKGLEQGHIAMDIVRKAAEAFPGTLWEDTRWSAEYITAVGGQLLKNDSFMIMCTGRDGVEEPRLFVYMHSTMTDKRS